MNRLFLFLLGCLLYACNGTPGYTIKGTVEGISDREIYLVSAGSYTSDTLATGKIKDGKFEIKGSCDDVVIAALGVEGYGLGMLPVYLENEEYKITLDLERIQGSKIEGGGEEQRLPLVVGNRQNVVIQQNEDYSVLAKRQYTRPEFHQLP